MSSEATISFRRSYRRLLYGHANGGHREIGDPEQRILQEVRTVVIHVLDAVDAIGKEEGSQIHIEGDYWDFLLFAQLVRELYSMFHFPDHRGRVQQRLDAAEQKMRTTLCPDLR